MFWWFFGGLVVMCFLALFPKWRFELMPFYARHICPTALRLLQIKYEVRNPERLRGSQPCIFTPRHQHIWDLFTVGSLMQSKTIVIGKKSMRWIPIFGWIFRRTGNLFIDRNVNADAIATMKDAHRRIIDLGLSVLVFPEGTRSSRGLLPFKKGPFHLAMGTKLPLLPIVVSSFRKSPKHVIVQVLEPIPTADWARDDIQKLIDLMYGRMAVAIEELDAELVARQDSPQKP